MGGCTRVCCSVVCFFAWWAHLVRSLECNGIRLRRVLFGMEGRLGQMMSDDNDDSRLLMPAGMFFVVIGGWLLSR